MGWQGSAEAEFKFKPVGKLEVSFTCPRCLHKQIVVLEWDENFSVEFTCENDKCGGKDTVRAEAQLAFFASYKDTNTVCLR